MHPISDSVRMLIQDTRLRRHSAHLRRYPGLPPPKPSRKPTHSPHPNPTEIIDPSHKAPLAISTAMLFTYLAGWLYTIVFCYVMGDPHALLQSPMAQPVAQIFYNVLGKPGGMAYTLAAFIVLKFVTFTAMQALGRTIFAFSRDRLLPLSSVWTRIMPLTGTPVLAVWLAVGCCIAINLIGLGSYTAIAGVFNVCAIALDWSYCIPIVCKLLFNKFEPGPWHMGKIGRLVNAWACVWTLFITVGLSLFPFRNLAGGC